MSINIINTELKVPTLLNNTIGASSSKKSKKINDLKHSIGTLKSSFSEFWTFRKISIRSCKSFKNNLDALLKKSPGYKRNQLFEEVDLLIAKSWNEFNLPDCFNNLFNYQFIVNKIAKILLDHQQPLEFKKQIIENVIANYISFFNIAVEQIQTDLKEDHRLLETFEIDPTMKTINIRVLGDETHNQGKNPLLIELSSNGKTIDKTIVYKPRSMITEKLICGPEGVFDAFHLPIYKIYDKKNYGYCEWLENNEEENRFESLEEIELYLNEFGLMDKIAGFLGLSDLHQGNVITSKKRPSLIDTEVLVPAITEAYTSGLVNGVTAGFVFEYNTHNRIWITDNLLNKQQIKTLNDPMMCCLDILTIFENLGVLDKTIKKFKIHEGVREFEKNEIDIIHETQKALSDCRHRLILQGTTQLTLLIQEDLHKGFNDFYKNIITGLKEWGFIPEFEKEELFKLFEQDVKNNDVPVFYFEPSTGVSYYGPLLLGKINTNPQK